MADENYEPRAIPVEASPELRTFLEDELAQIAYWINLLIEYNENNP